VAVVNPLGSGPDRLLPPAEWPQSPVLIIGQPGSGRRTWTDHLLRAHGVREVLVRRHEQSLPVSDARALGSQWFAVRSRDPRWAVLNLDVATAQAQNALLKTLEELPPNCRALLRGRPGGVLATVRSRCRVIRLTPATPEEEIDLVEAAGVPRGEAVELVRLRPGRPGAAIKLAESLPMRERASSLLSAAEAGDQTAIAVALLSDFDASIRGWVGEWCNAALAGTTTVHVRLASEAGKTKLRKAAVLTRTVDNPRLATRAALDVLANR